MTKLNLEKYFDNTDNKYYDASYLIKILEEILEKSIDNIKEDVKNIKITITRDEIENFLEKTFQEEEPKLKERIENRTRKKHKKNCQKNTTLEIIN